MNSEDNGRPEENDTDDSFNVSDFDDFGKELDNAVNESEQQQPQQTQQISSQECLY